MANTTTVQASVLYGAQDLRTEYRTITAPEPHELQISIRSTGICGSDQHYYNHYRNGDILVREPMSLGHESAGVVEAMGSSVPAGSFNLGDRVALEVGLPCGTCDRCREGRYNICTKMSFRSSAKSFPHSQGTLQQRINHPAQWCHKLPPNVSLDEGALLEPFSVAIHAVRRASLAPGSTTLVLGAGAVGLLTAAMLRVKGSSKIVIADIEALRVNFAIQNECADFGFVVPRKRGVTIDEKLEIAVETAELASSAAGGERFDAVFECTGVEACVQTAIYATRPGGKVLLIGMGTPIQTLPISAAALREVDLVGVFRYAKTYPYGISVLADKGKSEITRGVGRSLPDLSKLITHRYSGLENIPEAFKMAGRGVDDEGNLVLKNSKRELEELESCDP
ncbi:MAG: hypothetical protein M1818_006636 [Claussenomyces sp. TS43310]|nr:MAG: hypothetical protein M1818_006930 [Claussenomyces sp. TS43310]KAI9735059.1 MAG: hypothetical protein M1818_006636 [Claussenomyces sp. TS43310]